jgi:hypothetical protein
MHVIRFAIEFAGCAAVMVAAGLAAGLTVEWLGAAIEKRQPASRGFSEFRRASRNG